MANQKISAMTALTHTTVSSADAFALEHGGTTNNKMAWSEILAGVNAQLPVATNASNGVAHFPAATALTVSAGAVGVNVDGTSITISSNQLEVSGAIGSRQFTSTNTQPGVFSSVPTITTSTITDPAAQTAINALCAAFGIPTA